ncbi:serine hydrolase [Amycolatopsis coloradensis]|uniref:Serine hydrolase n=1 Tax=Amycolatopsis coloradensis TaxID=76021 RepID=A0A1R0KPS3_9PSEU|nr:serine hydrolase domain-containing protein [Amycolatopsis coloradensis]OLZ49154.1 serine hydrolase [Amycolatopsis coloradensis]
MRRSFVAIACAALLSVTALPAAAAGKTDPRQTAMDVAVAAGIPGMVAVADDFRGVSGVASIERPGKPDASGRWRVGSVSKVFVATLVLQLAGEKHVGLDEPVQRYLPGLLPYPEPITVRQLLQHTSGLPRDLLPEDSWATVTGPEVDTERFEHFDSDDQIRLSTKQPLQFKPGTSWAYSNTGYNVLGLLVEKTTRKPLERVLAERITGPLHLRDTSLPRDFPFLIGPAARGYEQLYDAPRGLTDVTTYNYSRYFGAGGVVSSGADLNRFFEALLGGRLLPADLLAQMKKTVPADGMEYGLGLMKLNLKSAGICAEDITIWGHGGDLPGFNTLSFRDDAGKNISTLATVDLTASPDAKLKRQLPMISEFCSPVIPVNAAAQAPVPSL